MGNQTFSVTNTSRYSLVQQHFNCMGTENHLSECPVSPPESQSRCLDVLRSAYIVCQGNELQTTRMLTSTVYNVYHLSLDRSVEASNCTDGSVRLQSGVPNIVRDGRVEVCLNKVWGTVCDRQFSEDDAQIVCAQMDFEKTSKSLRA